MADIQTLIRHARPPLRIVDPKTFLISWVYVFVNFGLAFYLFHNTPTLHVNIVNEVVTFNIWGMVFLAVAAVLIVGLVRNNWRFIRAGMFMGLFLKFFWAYALVAIAFERGLWRTIGSMAIWFGLAAIQAIVVIHFLPKDVSIKDGRLIK